MYRSQHFGCPWNILVFLVAEVRPAAPQQQTNKQTNKNNNNNNNNDNNNNNNNNNNEKDSKQSHSEGRFLFLKRSLVNNNMVLRVSSTLRCLRLD